MPKKSEADENNSFEDGIVAIGGELNPETLLATYSQGVFPWPYDDKSPIPWACPVKRGILYFKDLQIPDRLARKRRNTKWKFTIDEAFDSVIEECAKAPRPGQEGTWITKKMVRAYKEMHKLGYGHSAEAWSEDGKLIGGVYGLEIAGVFAGESMFFKEPDASKLALLFMIDQMRVKGAEWMDIQMLTPHMEKLGAKLIRRDAFLKLLRATQARDLHLFAVRIQK